MNESPSYEVVVVGGGPAGMTTAIYTTRLGHRTAVFEKEGGRHAAVNHVHNLYGVSEDVSGQQLASHAVEQLDEYGGDYYLEPVDSVHQVEDTDPQFVIEGEHATVEAERVVFATGFTDCEPPVPELRQFTGRGLHYCLHCDAYTLGDGRVFVLGHDEHAAQVAMLMLNFTAEIELLTNGRDPDWGQETERQVDAHPVARSDTEVVGAFADEEGSEQPWLGGLEFADGDDREYRGGFAVYGKEYNTSLAEQVGCDLARDGAISVDENYATSVEGVYAVGDVTHGQNQTVVAMGDGARAGIALDKDLRRYPVPAEELDDIEEMTVPAAAGDLRARMRLLRKRDTHAGLRTSTRDR